MGLKLWGPPSSTFPSFIRQKGDVKKEKAVVNKRASRSTPGYSGVGPSLLHLLIIILMVQLSGQDQLRRKGWRWGTFMASVPLYREIWIRKQSFCHGTEKKRFSHYFPRMDFISLVDIAMFEAPPPSLLPLPPWASYLPNHSSQGQ